MFVNNEFHLMNKDKIVLTFTCNNEFGDVTFNETHRSENAILPIGFKSIQSWIARRQAPKHREYIANLLRECGCYDLEGYIRLTHALSLNDTFWVKQSDSDLNWENVSLYTNQFDDTIAKIAFEGGLYGKQFTTTTPEFGTSGAYAKCWIRENDKIYLLKRGSEGTRNAGLEPYSEKYACQVARMICKNSVEYSVIKHHGKIASKCDIFTTESEGFVPAANFFDDAATVREIMTLFEKYDCLDDFRRMVVLDALIINTDRHMGNYGFIVDNDTMEIKRMAPIFDNNQALLPYAEDEDLNNLSKYLESRPTRIGEDFNAVAHTMLTPKLKVELNNMRGFKFDMSGDFNLAEERVNILENMLNAQIDRILDNKRLYVPEKIGELFQKQSKEVKNKKKIEIQYNVN